MRVTNKHLEPRGCDTIGDTITDEKIRRLHILVSLMLSSPTTGTMTVAAMDRLSEQDFTVQYALDVDQDELAKIIYPVGFWRVRLLRSRRKVNDILLLLAQSPIYLTDLSDSS